jgi:hypothetical protein
MTDSNVKIASVEPMYTKTRTFWQNQGFTAEQVETVLNEIAEAEREEAANNAINAIFGGGNGDNNTE